MLSEQLRAASLRAEQEGRPEDAYLFLSAAAYAKRYEDAPAMSVSMVAEGHIVGLYLHPVTDASAAHELTGQRVRILLDAEGE